MQWMNWLAVVRLWLHHESMKMAQQLRSTIMVKFLEQGLAVPTKMVRTQNAWMYRATHSSVYMQSPFCKSYCYYYSFSWARMSSGTVTMGWQYRACQWSIPRDDKGAKWSSGWENNTVEAESTPDWFVNLLSTQWLCSLKLGKLSLAVFRELFVSWQTNIAFSILPLLFNPFWFENVCVQVWM